MWIREELALPYTGEEEAVLIDSGEWTGEACLEAQEKMARFAEENGFGKKTTTYRLKDWGVSRQRYWGTPIPMVYCERGHDGVKPGGVVALPESALPVLLPEQIEITQEGGSPLGKVPEFVNTTCPVCGGPARRETDTMDTFVDSSWYFYRYTDAKNASAPFDSREGELLVSDRPVYWRRGARDSAPDLFALLDEGDARSGADQEREPADAAVYAGHGDQGRREDVEVQGQRGVART